MFIALAFAATAAIPGIPPPPTPMPRPFGKGNTFYHPTAIAPYRFENSIIRVRFDFERGIVYGHESVIIRPKRDALAALPFNSLGISYSNVSINGRTAHYTLDSANQLVNVRLPAPVSAGARIAVDFTYSARPQRGIYFIRPDKGYPSVTPEIWSQGEMIDNRRWFPTWDQPNEKTPSELIVTVQRGWTVVANGYLKGHSRTATGETWDWNAPHPKSTYLIAFAAGPLSENRTTLGQVPVDSFVQPPLARLNALCFGDTKDIVGFFQDTIGVAFPWEKYDQTTAERFTYGGMENASATIQTDRALHLPIENEESPCDGLVAHELAHQWWGDDVTMADWANTWINEGYATYFQELWSEKHFGEPEFEYERYLAQQSYFNETKAYYRPIVDYNYNDPLDLFDSSGYPRPGQVLHMLRWMFGDERFYKALRDYLNEYQYKNADTHQFFAAIEKSLGTDLSWFEHEWFYRAAYPNYFVKQKYDLGSQTLTLDVTQKNHDGLPFRMPVEIEAYFGTKMASVRPTIDRNRQVITMTGIGEKPQMVLFDPNNNILRQLTFPKSASELGYQLARAAHVGDRHWALDQLGDFAQQKGSNRQTAMAAVGDAARFDDFYGMRSDAAAVAAMFDDASTVLAALHDKDKRVRIAAAGAAGDLRTSNSSLISTLKAMSNDPDPLVASSALQSLGALKPAGAYSLLVAALDRPSFRQTVASGALQGLAAYGEARAIPLIRARTVYGTNENERGTAVRALARLAAHLQQPDLALSTLLEIAQHDPLITTRIAAVRALGTLGDPRAVPILQQIEQQDSQQAVQTGAWNSILDIKDAQKMEAYQKRYGKERAK